MFRCADAGRDHAVDAYNSAAAVLPRREIHGENLTRLRGDYRQQLTSWLQGQAELTISVQASAIARMESTELNWHEAQRRQSELTAFPRH
jgi:ABC-type transport system involved in cytochrome bd biosynthesis fused ATPase/permease subunit